MFIIDEHGSYSANQWVKPSLVKNFTVYEMGAKKKQAAPPTPLPPAPEVPSVWIPSKPLPIPPVPNQTAPPVLPPEPPPTDFTGLILAGLVAIVVLGGIGGTVFYLWGRRRRGL